MKPTVKNYFSITKTEWNGLVVLLVLIAVVLAIPYVYTRCCTEVSRPDYANLNRALAQLKQAGITGRTDSDIVGQPRLFKFNPNNLPVSKWRALGLSMQQIKGIKNYEAAGGRFYTRADVKKMYTLTTADYQQLEPYIDLPYYNKEITPPPLIIIELNTADSASLTRLKGIGPAFARRIIQYRQRLGGYHSKQQLKEIYGMDAMRYADVQGQLRVNAAKVKKMDANKVEYEDLKDFPYLSYKQMNAIIQYRQQHGNYETFDELGHIAILNPGVLRKIKPYLVVK